MHGRRGGFRQASRESAFNPGISLVLQGTLARSTRDPDTYAISGFAPSGGEVAPPRRGFGIGESELFVSASIDPYLRGQLVAAGQVLVVRPVLIHHRQPLLLGKRRIMRGIDIYCKDQKIIFFRLFRHRCIFCIRMGMGVNFTYSAEIIQRIICVSCAGHAARQEQ